MPDSLENTQCLNTHSKLRSGGIRVLMVRLGIRPVKVRDKKINGGIRPVKKRINGKTWG